MSIELNILNSCSNKSYNTLCETYGKEIIDSLLNQDYIMISKDNKVLKTEKGIKFCKPLDVTENYLKEKGGHLLIDNKRPNSNEQLILS